jgi:hypothetical protein
MESKQKQPKHKMTLIVDVDINLLKELHEHGSVNTMKDRRHDLYSLKAKVMKNCLECTEKLWVEDKNSAVMVVAMPIITK